MGFVFCYNVVQHFAGPQPLRDITIFKSFSRQLISTQNFFLLPFLRLIFIYLVFHHCKLLLNHFYTYFRYHWLCNNSLENLSVRSLHHPSPGKWDLGH